MRSSRLLVLLLALLLPGLILAPAWQSAGLGADEDDVLYYYPSRVFFQECIQSGHWPWLNPLTGLGRPFLADPQSAVFYPTTWLFAFLNPLVAYPTSLWLHYSLAFLGMYRLLRSRKLGRHAAIFGSVAFAFCGFLLAHRAHFTLLQAAAWTPWVFWRFQRYIDRGGSRRLAIVALVAAAQCFAGHVQMAAITALGTLIALWAEHGVRIRVSVRWLLGWVVAGGLYAVQWLPTLAYLRVCTRVDRGYLDFVENSWNPVSVIGWIFPMLLGQRTPNFFGQTYWGPSHQVEQFTYAGVIPLLLALLAFRAGWRPSPEKRSWAVLSVFALLLALGLFGPICPLLYWLPGASLFRVPARAMVLVNLGIAALAAGVVDDLGAQLTARRAQLRAVVQSWTILPLLRSALFWFVPLAIVAAALPFMPAATHTAALGAILPWNPCIWVPALMLFLAFPAIGLASRRWQNPRWLLLLTPLAVVDLAVIGWTIDVPEDRPPLSRTLATTEREAWASHVRGSRERIWVVNTRVGFKPGEYVSPRDKGVANVNTLDHLASLTDYGPLQPRSLHSVIPFEPWGELPEPDARLRDTSWMRRYNVGWILLCDESLPEPADSELITTTPAGSRLYRYADPGGLAFFDDLTNEGAVRYAEHSPYQFSTRISNWPDVEDEAGDRSAPVRVVVSHAAIPGWHARVGEYELPVRTTNEGLLAVDLPKVHYVEVVWRYYPPGLEAGAAISGLTAILVAFALMARTNSEPG